MNAASAAVSHDSLRIDRLPKVRGKYREQADLSAINWFRVGGKADVLFRPADADDLAMFLRHKPQDVPVTILGVGSNLIVRDGGIEGVVVRLGRGFVEMTQDGLQLTTGAGALDLNVAEYACQHGVAGLEFLSGIPGTIGGALAMNGGAYGSDIASVLVEAELVTTDGELLRFTTEQLKYGYRHCAGKPEGAVFTRATLRGTADTPEAIAVRMGEIRASREASQPIRSRTGGSTFKNPPGYKAWELVDRAGCRGLTIGGAKISEQHCNFMINTGTATAADLEELGEEVRRRVKDVTGIQLEWEIKRIGRP